MLRKKARQRGGLFLCLAVLLVGCGSEASTAEEKTTAALEEFAEDFKKESTKEFALPDGSASLHLNQEWEQMEAGYESFMLVSDKNGRDGAYLFQFPKDSFWNLNDMSDIKEVINETFHISDEEAIEAFEVPGMSNISVSLCTISLDGVEGRASMLYGETEYAYYSIGCVDAMSRESKDGNASLSASLRLACGTFTETVPEAEEQDQATVELTDTILWFNAVCGILTEMNGEDLYRFAGMPVNKLTQRATIASLDSWWGVTDRLSADEMREWLLNEGHSVEFADGMKYLQEAGLGDAEDRAGFIMEHLGVSEEEALMYLDGYEMYEQYGENAIYGWDYCRAMNLMKMYYVAGYYTEQEALDWSLEIAQAIQPMFESWDDLMDSYLRGYEYWAKESSAERRAVYEELKTREDSLYQIDFKLNLQKTW